MTQETMRADFEALIDYASKQALLGYDKSISLWFFLKKDPPSMSIADLAMALHVGDKEKIISLLESEHLEIHKSIKTIPENNFLCIYMGSAYVLTPYS